MPNFMKILSVGAELFVADRRTDTTDLIFALSKFREKRLTICKYNLWKKNVEFLIIRDNKS